MIALGIFAVCINVQSFADLVKLLASSLSCGSDSAVLFRMGQYEKKVLVLHFSFPYSSQSFEFWETEQRITVFLILELVFMRTKVMFEEEHLAHVKL